MPKVFVTVDEIVENPRFVDTRFSMQNVHEGKALYEQGHIHGAIYWDLEKDLSDMSSTNGRHPMPSKEQLQTLFENSGLHDDDFIYVYDQGGAPFAARAWYLLTYAGFSNVWIVNGGFPTLKDEFPVTISEVEYERTSLTLVWQEQLYASRQDVKRVVDGLEQATLLDARTAVRYRGEKEPLDPVAGHIPTAKNFDWEQLKVGKELQPNDNLRSKVQKDEQIIVYCGSGVTASPLYAALTHDGYTDLRLYMGSYSDWITVYDVATGDENL